jgi:Holliday junction resolvase
MSNYANGAAFENRVGANLQADGYRWIRAAGSKGAADIWAAKPGQLLFVSVKRTKGNIGPAERAALVKLAASIRTPTLETLPIVAHQPEPRKPIRWRLLTGTGPGDWVDWTPDQVAA